MASQVLSVSRRQEKPIVFVGGRGHASQMHRFIENPRFALRYIRKIREQATPEHYPGHYSLNEILNKAEREFKALQEEHQPKAS